MKFKVFAILFLLCFALLLVGCSSRNNNPDDSKGDEKEKTFTLKTNDLTLKVGDEVNLELETTESTPVFTLTSSDSSIVLVDGQKVKALKSGEVTITVKMDGCAKDATLKVKVLDPKINLTGPSEMNVDDSEKFVCTLTDVEGSITWEVSNPDVLRVVDGFVTALAKGTSKVIAKVGDLSAEVEVTVVQKIDNVFFTSSSLQLTYGVDYELTYSISPASDKYKLEFTSSDENIATVNEKGILHPVGVGTITVTLSVNDGDATATCSVYIEDVDDPEFILEEGTEKRQRLGWNEPFDPLKGIKAIDNLDGDITENIQVISNDLNNKKYGLYTIRYRVSDSSGNKANLVRHVEVYWQYDVTFIGHAGCFYGPMNSEEAFFYALDKLHYQAIECDLKQTKDGVFVMSHNDTFGDKTIASCNWSEFENYEITIGRTGGIPSQNGSVTGSPYTTKLCTLARYLELCRSYGAKAVIELKSSNGITNSSQTRMQALMDEIEKAGMRDDVIFLGSQYNCLIWTREHGYEDIECQYLVNSLDSQTVLDRCIKYNLDVSCNVTSSYTNSVEWIAKYKEADLKVSTYTFTQYVDYDVVQEWIDKGADYVTCDWHLMEKLNLPLHDDTPKPTYTVTFKDYDGKVLKEATVVQGKTAAAPAAPTRLGYTFVSWSAEVNNVQSDLEVTAVYTLNTYTITYNANLVGVEEGTWASKAEFVDTLYTDLYNWFKTNGVNSEYVTVTGDTVKIVKNGVTVEFSNIDELKAIDIYDFEKTVSNFFFKPLVRNADGTANIEEDSNYFINTGDNKLKYASFDAYIMNCRKEKYPAYDDTYTPTSVGKIQIFFRFHQWVKTTSTTLIPPFETLPTKYTVLGGDDSGVTLPADHLTYTVNDEFELPVATCEGKVFAGWYSDSECTQKVERIGKNSTGNIILYAKWE